MLAFMLVSTKAVRCVDWGWVRWGGGAVMWVTITELHSESNYYLTLYLLCLFLQRNADLIGSHSFSFIYIFYVGLERICKKTAFIINKAKNHMKIRAHLFIWPLVTPRGVKISSDASS